MSHSFELLGVREELSPEHERFLPALRKGCENFNFVYDIFNSAHFEKKDGWKKEAEKDGEIVHSLDIEAGRLYNVHFETPMSLAEFIEEDWDGVTRMAEWNEHVEFAKILHVLSENANIVHYANRKILTVAGRDYTTIRIRRCLDGVVYTAGTAVELPELPESPDRVRGILHVGGGFFRAHPEKTNTTIVDMLVCLDMRGSIPKMMINSMMGSMLLKDVKQQIRRAEQRAGRRS